MIRPPLICSDRLVIILAVLGIFVVRHDANAQNVRGPRASDLVSLHSTPYGEDPVPVLRQWGMDRIGWGLPPQRQQGVESWAKAWITKHRSAGVRYHAVLNLSLSNGYLTGPQPELLATRCLGPDGQFIGPHHSGVLGTINGQPTWYHCIHHPQWRQYLRDALGYSFAAGAQGIEFDAPLANGNSDSRQDGACFCEHCLRAFEAASPDLPMRGDDLRTRLASLAKTQAKVTTDPLLVRYYTFQVESAARLLRELVSHGRGLHPDAEFSANSYDLLPESLAAAAACDSLLAEISHYAELWNEATVPRSLAWRYRLPDALGRRLVATATLWEWRYLQDHQCDDLLKLWFAAAYAHGHLFVVPNAYNWSGKPYRGRHADFAALLRFVKDHARLLDDYTHVPAALVLYSPDDVGAIGGNQAAFHHIMGIAEALAYRHADFDFAIAQTRYFDAPAWPQRRLLIVPEGTELSAADQTRVDEYAKMQRASTPSSPALLPRRRMRAPLACACGGEGGQSSARELTPIADKAMRLCDRLHRPARRSEIRSKHRRKNLGPDCGETAANLPQRIN